MTSFAIRNNKWHSTQLTLAGKSTNSTPTARARNDESIDESEDDESNAAICWNCCSPALC